MPNNHSPSSLDDLAVFIAVTEAGGFRSAARRLGLSASTVSETIARLEGQIGVPLLNRTTRSVRPTEVGRRMAERLGPLLSGARAAIDEAASTGNEVRGRLKLNVPGAVMVDILPPLIAGFLQRHPGVRVEVMVDDRLVDITAQDCDAGIRYGEHLAQDMIAIPIGPRRQTGALAASPAYLARRGIPRHPSDLLHHDCIRIRFASGALSEWEFGRDGDRISIDPPPRIVVGAAASAAAIDLAIRGQGIISAFGNWLEPHLKSGALVPVLQDWWIEFDGPRLYFSNRFMPTPLRAFIDFIASNRSENA
jgi:DNA-binding transcriptional LysR family regulator